MPKTTKITAASFGLSRQLGRCCSVHAQNLPATVLLLPGLERLADHLAFLREAQNRETARYFAERVAYAYTGDGAVASAALPLEAWMADAPPSFWVDAFHRLAAETPARPRPSNKALANFCDWLRRALPRRRPTTCELGAAFRAALEFRGDEAPVLTVRYLRAP